MSQVMGSMARQAIPVTIAGGSQVTVRPSLVGPLIVTAVFGIVASIFWPTFAYMLGFGREANSSAPVALVFVVVLALVWNLRDELVMLRIRPFLPSMPQCETINLSCLCSRMSLSCSVQPQLF